MDVKSISWHADSEVEMADPNPGFGVKTTCTRAGRKNLILFWSQTMTYEATPRGYDTEGVKGVQLLRPPPRIVHLPLNLTSQNLNPLTAVPPLSGNLNRSQTFHILGEFTFTCFIPPSNATGSDATHRKQIVKDRFRKFWMDVCTQCS